MDAIKKIASWLDETLLFVIGLITLLSGLKAMETTKDAVSMEAHYYTAGLGTLLLAFTLFELAKKIIAVRKTAQQRPVEIKEVTAEERQEKTAAQKRVLLIIGMVFGYIVLMRFFSFDIPTILFLACFFYFYSDFKWYTSLISAVSITWSLYFIFVTVAGVTLARGVYRINLFDMIQGFF